MKNNNSHRQILRSSSIIGASSLLNILVSLVRTKVLAVLLGPSGVGLVGLLLTLMTTVSSVSAMGLGTVGTRQIAEAAGRDNSVKLSIVRRALFWATLLLAVGGATSTWLLRELLAERLFADQRLANEIGWLGLGVALTVAAGSQGALLNGMRHIGDMARLSIFSALASTLLGLAALWLWGRDGLIGFVLAVPLSSFVLGHFFVSRLPKLHNQSTQLSVLLAQWRTLFQLGAAFMLTGLIWNLGHLFVRTLVQRELGAVELGQFQAAWAISMTYIGFVLQAMGADYYPRLSGSMDDHSSVSKLVNDQTEVALLLAGPVILAMLGLAPWVIEFLYTSEFGAAASVLRWQILGDILRVAAWPLGYVVLAAGDGRKYLMMESFAVSVLVSGIWFGLPIYGLEATGVAFILMYSVYLPVVYYLARQKTSLAWASSVYWLTGVLVVIGALVAWVASVNTQFGALLGLVASGVFGFFSIAKLSHMANLTGPLARLAAVYRRFSRLKG